jgi:hypothetical protein
MRLLGRWPGSLLIHPTRLKPLGEARGIESSSARCISSPSQAKDVSQPTGYEVAPCMDKAATEDREPVRDKNFISQML